MKFGLVLVGALLAGTAALAQSNGKVEGDAAAAAKALAARSGFETTYELQCRADAALPAALRNPTTPPATKLFDNFYFVGLSSVGAYALKTSAGIILFDTLDNPQEAETVIVPGLKALGLDPASIKYVVISHAHGDHYGGARWLHDTFGARVVASKADWEVMEHPRAPGGPSGAPPPNWGQPPARDIVAEDGQKLTLGDTTVTLVVTPGHTPGTLSFLIPVKDHGAPHTLAMWGGTGLPRDPAALDQYIASFDHFASVAAASKPDVELSNHPFVDDTLDRMTALRARPNGPNPFVIGPARYADYQEILKRCAIAHRAPKVASAKP